MSTKVLRTCPDCGETYSNVVIGHWDERSHETYETELICHTERHCIRYLRARLEAVEAMNRAY